MKQLLLSLSVLSLAAAPLAAHAAPCRDAHGRFITCAKSAAAKPAPHAAAGVPPTPHRAAVTAAKAAPKRCKIGGRFASCAAPGAKPA
jgi:hypothetical protein